MLKTYHKAGVFKRQRFCNRFCTYIHCSNLSICQIHWENLERERERRNNCNNSILKRDRSGKMASSNENHDLITTVFSPGFAVIITSSRLRRLSTRFWDHGCVDVRSFSQKSINELRRWCWVNRGSMCSSSFHRCSLGLKLRALCRPLEFFYSNLGEPCLHHGAAALCPGALPCFSSSEGNRKLISKVYTGIQYNAMLLNFVTAVWGRTTWSDGLLTLQSPQIL